jgi:poly(3-hydroxybutyrate) depolymerase
MRPSSLFAPALVASVAFCALLSCRTLPESSDDDDSSPLDNTSQQLEAESGSLATLNAAGRAGSYYLPSRNSNEPVPLLVGFHATGGSGEGFLSSFSAQALARGFAIVAPDSRVSPAGDFTWEVGTEPGEITPDYTHALNCIDELREEHDLLIDPQHVLAAGYSGGASSAPYLASNEDLFSAFASLHGGVFPGGVGDHIVRGWFSTGEDDDLRSPDHVQDHLDSLVPLGFDDLELHVFPGGHGLSGEEVDALVDWWLGDL